MSGNIAAKLALQRQKTQSNNSLPSSASTASTFVSTQDDLYCSPGMRPSTADSFDRQFQSFVSSSFDSQLSSMLADIEQDDAFSNNDEKRDSTPGRGLAIFQQRKPSNVVVDNRENASADSPPNDVRLMPPPPPRTTPKEKDIEKEPDEPMENVMEDDMKLDPHKMMQEPEVSLPIVDASTLESAPDDDDNKENRPVSTETTINAMTPKTNNKSTSIVLKTPQQQSSNHKTNTSINGNANTTEMLFDRHDPPQSMVTPSPHAAPRANQENLSKEDHHTEFPRIHDFGHDLEGYLLALQEFKDNHLMSDQDIFLFHLLIDQVNATMNAQILEMQAMMDLLDEIEEEQNDMMEMHRNFDNPAFRDKLATDQTNDKTM